METDHNGNYGNEMYSITALLHFVLGNNIFWAQLHFRKTFAD